MASLRTGREVESLNDCNKNASLLELQHDLTYRDVTVTKKIWLVRL
jgi:hypothetical protein